MIRPALQSDADSLLALRRLLWPEGPNDDHARDIEAFFLGRAREPLEILVAVEEASPGAEDRGVARLVGFCELSIRAYAEGCSSDRVAYLEGWFVVEGLRNQGVGRALVEGAEEWAREQGCTEFASDAEVDNEVSAAAHLALGFSDEGLIRCFRKQL